VEGAVVGRCRSEVNVDAFAVMKKYIFAVRVLVVGIALGVAVLATGSRSR
jgi:hypothetical protein